MVRGRKTLSFMKGRGKVTLAIVNLPSMYLLYQRLLSKLFSPDLAVKKLIRVWEHREK